MLGAIVGLTLLLLSDGVIDPAGRSSRTRNLRIFRGSLSRLRSAGGGVAHASVTIDCRDSV